MSKTGASQALIKQIKDAAYLEGDFTTRAGKKTTYYIDKYLFETKPEILQPLAKDLAQLLPPLDTFDHLIAPALGAVSIAAVLSLEVNKPFVIAEKRKSDSETPQDLLVGTYKPGDKVVVIEDVLTTGITVLNICDVLKEVPLEVVKVISVINREEGAEASFIEKNIPVASLITKTDLQAVS